MSDLDQGATEQAATAICHPGIGLMQFCSKESWRPALRTPFRRLGYVWATNGHVLLRVADDPRYPVVDSVAAEKVIPKIDEVTFTPAPTVTLPPRLTPDKIACPSCDGRGTEHDCPDCECKCDDCDGKGTITDMAATSTSLDGVIFNLEYLRMIYTLPDLEIARGSAHSSDAGVSPLYFRFEGGHGVLMPMRSPYESHVEIQATSAA